MSAMSDRPYVYADNAATTRLSDAALSSMMPFLTDEYGNPSQPYTFARSAKRALGEAREIIASCINAAPEEIVFTSGGTESDNLAIKGFALRDSRPKEIVTSCIEHHAVLNSCKSMEVLGHNIKRLPVDSGGVIRCESLRSIPLETGALVSCMYANNEIGTIQPIDELGEIAHGRGALFHTDAVQAVGHMKIDVKESNIDLLSASAHKFNGPRGIGFLYIKRGIPIAPYVDGGSQEMGLRAGTENVASVVAMATALRENCSTIDENVNHLRGLEGILLEELSEMDIEYHRNGENCLPGMLSLSFANTNGETLLHRLDLMRIAISTGSACDGSQTKISHVLRAIGLDEETARRTIRISLGKHNTEEEIHIISSALQKVLNTY